MSWGQEVLVDCRGCNDNIDSTVAITEFIYELCRRIEMTRVGDPEFVHIDDLGDKSGYTVFQMIRTSSIVVHFCRNGDAFFNIFSCKSLSATIAKEVIDQWFTPKEMQVTHVKRGMW